MDEMVLDTGTYPRCHQRIDGKDRVVKRVKYTDFQCKGEGYDTGYGCWNIATIEVVERHGYPYAERLKGYHAWQVNKYCDACFEKIKDRVVAHRKIDTSSLVQCTTCSNFLVNDESWEMGYSHGKCKGGKIFENDGEHDPVTCSHYNKPIN
jgi:hypothetical protein